LLQNIYEYENSKQELPQLSVDDHLVIVYTYSMYFFVPKSQQKLHDMIYKGMSAAYESGAMEKLLLEDPTLKAGLKKAKLKERVRIDLPAYNITDETLDTLERFRLPGFK
jgi:hypothetical protein